MNTVKFSKGNTKLKKTAEFLGLKKAHVFTFSLPAGWSCPAASLCKSKVAVIDGKKKRQDFGQFVCYATKAELIYPAVYNARQNNFDALRQAKTTENMYNLLEEALPKNAKIVRYHDSGDFFNEAYFQAWLKLAENNPHVIFFGYTKMLQFAEYNSLPSNFYIVYSHGGRYDNMKNESTQTCYVLTSDNSENLGNGYARLNHSGEVVKIVCDGKNSSHEDYLQITSKNYGNFKSFGILVH